MRQETLILATYAENPPLLFGSWTCLAGLSSISTIVASDRRCCLHVAWLWAGYLSRVRNMARRKRSLPRTSRIVHAEIAERFVPDSPLEGEGFEPSVPRMKDLSSL